MWPWPPKPDPIQARLDKIDAVLARIESELEAAESDLTVAINKPAWLSPPASAAAVTYHPPVVDVGGEIYNKLDGVQSAITQLKGLEMATQAELQAVADSLTESMTSLEQEVASEDGAIAALLTWVQQNPAGGVIPDAIVQQLTSAQSVAQQVVADVTGQTAAITSGTPSV